MYAEADKRGRRDFTPLEAVWTDADGKERSFYELEPVTSTYTANEMKDFGNIADDVEVLLGSYCLEGGNAFQLVLSKRFGTSVRF
jgi:methyl coenzyme M reductase alpha subunit